MRSLRRLAPLRGARARVVPALALGAALLAPHAVGALPDSAGPIWAAIALVGIGCVASPVLPDRAAIRIGLPLASFGVSLAAMDLALRPLLASRLYHRPHERFYVSPWPPIPLLTRYEKGASYEGETFGDLAAITGVAAHRETRRVSFRTDAFGFRNEVDAADATIDVIVLGDSFGAGNGSTQERIWPRVLADRHGLAVYNLSLPGGPWHELINLKLELGRLRTRRRPVVLWVLFTGNDLHEDVYFESLDPPAFSGPIRQLQLRIERFRGRSPAQLLWRRWRAPDRARAAQSVLPRNGPAGRPVLFRAFYAQLRATTAEQVRAHPNYPGLERVFRGMRDFAIAEDLAVAVVAVPSKAEVYSWIVDGTSPWSTDPQPSALGLALRELSGTAGFDFLDLKPNLVRASEPLFRRRRALLWWHDDTHWNELGHAAVASIVHARLVRELLADE